MKEETEFQPRLYIIMREDLWDMNPGKAMAQAAHAQADFDAQIEKEIPKLKPDREVWREDRNFGTTIVLSGTLDQLNNIVSKFDYFDVAAGMTVDPTYPYRNYYGKVFTSEEVTCGWLFAATQEQADLVAHLPLHQ